MDANLDAAARVIRRARRRPEKGGLPNLVLVRAAADRLPAGLAGRVDELRIDLPWGSLLEGLVGDDPALLMGIARLVAPGGRLRIVLNARSLPDGLTAAQAEDRLRHALAAADLVDIGVDSTAIAAETAWGKRLAGARALAVIIAEGRRPLR